MSELNTYLAAEGVVEGITDEDAVPELPEKPVSFPGDLWIVENHRVLCGDATVSADVRRLMAGDSADLVFTDPPYNVEMRATPKTASRSKAIECRVPLRPERRKGRRLIVCLPFVIVAAGVPERAGVSRLRGALPRSFGRRTPSR
jgi:hypothetical protein